MLAKVTFCGKARGTRFTQHIRIYVHSVPDFSVLYFVAHCDDFARKFVTENYGRVNFRTAFIPFKYMYIRPANAAIRHLYEHFIPFDFGNGNIFDFYIMPAVKYGRFH